MFVTGSRGHAAEAPRSHADLRERTDADAYEIASGFGAR
jgi:hypothetical protein